MEGDLAGGDLVHNSRSRRRWNDLSGGDPAALIAGGGRGSCGIGCPWGGKAELRLWRSRNSERWKVGGGRGGGI